MTYRGHIKNGVVVLDEPAELPEGLEVRVETVSPSIETQTTWNDVFKGVTGKAKDLPTDMAENHDHYLHGAPKQ